MMKKILLILSILAVVPLAAKEFSIKHQQQLKQEMTLPVPGDCERIILSFIARL